MATPIKTNSLCEDNDDKKPRFARVAVTSSPTGKRLTAAPREDSKSNEPPHMFTTDAEDCNSDDEAQEVIFVAAKKISSLVSDEKARARHGRLELNASYPITKPEPNADKFAPKEEKAECFKDNASSYRQAAAGGPRRHSGSTDQGSVAPLPPRHLASEKVDAVAKRYAGAPLPSRNLKVCKPSSTTTLGHPGFHQSSVDSNSYKRKEENTGVFAKHQASGPASATAHRLDTPALLASSLFDYIVAPINIMSKEENADVLARPRTRGAGSAAAYKQAPTTAMASALDQPRVAFLSKKSTEDAAILAKRRARAPTNCNAICKLPPPTMTASSLSYSTAACFSTKIAIEKAEAALGKCKAMPPVKAAAICKLTPSTFLATKRNIVSGSNKSATENGEAAKHQVRAPVDATDRTKVPHPMPAFAPLCSNLVSSTSNAAEENAHGLGKCQWYLPAKTGPTVHKLAPSTMPASATSHSSAAANVVTQNCFDDAACATRIKAIGLALQEDGMIVAEVGSPAIVRDAGDAKLKAHAIATPRSRAMDEADVAVRRNARKVSAEWENMNAAPRRRATVTALPFAGDLPNSVEGESEQFDCDVGAYSVGHEDEDAVGDYLAKVAWNQAQEDSGDADVTCGVNLNAALSGSNLVEELGREDRVDNGLLCADDGDNLEAEGGVPVTPGAFAVEGHEHQSERETSPPQHNTMLTDSNSLLFMEPSNPEDAMESQALSLQGNQQSSALEAELLEVFEANVLVDDYEDRKWSKECTHRWGVAAIALLASISTIVAVAVTQTKANNGETLQDVLPVINKGWNQLGTRLAGPTDDDKSLFGFDIAMDGQAHRIAIGVPGRDHGETELLTGSVLVVDWNGTDWQPHLPIFGPGLESQAGSAVAISRNGKRVAVGAPHFALGRGHVAVYEEVEPTQWEIVGQILTGDESKEDIDERFGGSLALSDEGNTLAVGAVMGDGERGVDMGYVKVFQLETLSQRGQLQEWTQLGNTIYGENPGDFFGWSLDISSNGERFVVGSVGSFGDGIGEFAGQVCAFDYGHFSNAWVQAGPAITGIAPFDSFGSSVSLSSDGDCLAVGAIGHSKTEKGVDVGHVRVFEFVDSPTGQSWKQLGQPLVGHESFDSFGHSVSLSEDGKVVAIGAPGNEEFSECSGVIQVFALDETAASWNQRGSNIGGSCDGSDLFGWVVSLSSDGSVVAGGEPFSTLDGRLDNVGTVRIYDAVGENHK